MGNKTRFSIITITFNAERVIGNTIDSVISQNYKDMEYIFIDGGSYDKTNQIITQYTKKLDELGIHSVHISEADEGISDAFNKGILNSNGEIIVILNADDELLPGALKKIDVEMKKDIDIVYGNCQWNDEKKKITYIRKSKKKPNNLIYAMVLMHPATFVRKSMYEKIGMFNTDYKYSMDRELLVRMLKGGARFKYVDYEFTIMKAGGVSDTNFWAVLREGDQIPRMYGMPEIIIKLYDLKKYIKHKLSHLYRQYIKK